MVYRYTTYSADITVNLASLARMTTMPTPILGKDNKARQVAYRRLLRTALDKETVSEIRLAL